MFFADFNHLIDNSTSLSVKFKHEIYPPGKSAEYIMIISAGYISWFSCTLKVYKSVHFCNFDKKIASNSINHSIRFQSVTSSHFFHVFTFLFRNIGTLNFVFFSIFGSTFAFRRRMSILKKSCKLYAILIAFFGFCGCLSTSAQKPPVLIESERKKKQFNIVSMFNR